MIINYKRILSDTQDHETQLKGVECDVLYVDISSNHKHISKRSQLNKILNFLKKNDIVNVASINILAPNITELVKIAESIINKGAVLNIVNDDIQIKNKDSFSLITLRKISNFEQEKIKENNYEAKLKAKGLRKFQGGRPKLSKEQIKQVREMNNKGFPAPRIAEKFNISRHTVYNIVNNKLQYTKE